MKKKEISGTKEWSVESVNCVTGCSHDCRYCYARYDAVVRRKRVKSTDWPKMVVRDKDVRKKRKKAAGTVMFPTTHDITPEVLEPCSAVLSRLLTAGNKVLVVTKPHLSCVKALCLRFQSMTDRILFRFTIGAMQDGILKFWEPNAPGFAERLRCLMHAFDNGFETSVSSEPLLDFDRIGAMHDVLLPFVTDSWWIGKMNEVRKRVDNYAPFVEEKIQEVEMVNEDSTIRWLHKQFKDDPKVKWKESIKKVVGIDLARKAGEDR